MTLERCFLPIHVYDTATARSIAVLLRSGKTASGREMHGHIRRLVRRIRTHLRRTKITIRGDSHYGRHEAMAWCEANAVDYVFGLGTKSWKCERRVGARIEATCNGLNILYVVTNIVRGSAEWLYDTVLRARPRRKSDQAAQEPASDRDQLPLAIGQSGAVAPAHRSQLADAGDA
jgi:hypothetical protein